MGKDKEKKSKKSKEETEDAGAAAEAMDVDASPAKGKEKKARESMGGDADEGSGPSYESRLKALSPIAQPLASKKLTKKLLKVVKKSAKSKAIKRGVKEVVKGLRKGTKGFVVIAGDISPIDVITHVPILCEEANVPYCYVPSKEDLGQAGSTKRPTSCIMVVPGKGDADESYEECFKELKTLDETIISA